MNIAVLTAGGIGSRTHQDLPKQFLTVENAEYIASLANLKVRYEIENNESVSKATYALLDTRKIKNIGWEPQYSVKDGLKRTYTIKKETLGSM